MTGRRLISLDHFSDILTENFFLFFSLKEPEFFTIDAWYVIVLTGNNCLCWSFIVGQVDHLNRQVRTGSGKEIFIFHPQGCGIYDQFEFFILEFFLRKIFYFQIISAFKDLFAISSAY